MLKTYLIALLNFKVFQLKGRNLWYEKVKQSAKGLKLSRKIEMKGKTKEMNQPLQVCFVFVLNKAQPLKYVN